MAAVVAVMLTPAIWADKINELLADYYAKGGEWQVNFNSVEGHLLTSTVITDIQFTRRDSTQVLHSPQIEFSINPGPWLLGKYAFRTITINDLQVFVNRTSEENKSHTNFNPDIIDLSIRKLALAGQIHLSGYEGFDSIDLKYDGRLRVREQSAFLFIKNLFITDLADIELEITQSGIQLFNDELIVNELKAKLNGQSMIISVEGDLAPDFELSGSITSLAVNTWKDSTAWPLVDPLWRSVDVSAHFSTNLKELTAGIKLAAGEQEIITGIDLLREGEIYKLNKFELNTGSGRIEGRGTFESDGVFRGRLDIYDMDASTILLNFPKTGLSGMVLFEGRTAAAAFSEMWLSLEFSESALIPGMVNHFSGSLSVGDSLVKIDNPLVLGLETGNLTITGQLNYRNQGLNLATEFSKMDVARFIHKNQDLDKCLVSGNLRLQGVITAPRLNGSVELEQLDWREVRIEKANINSQFTGNLQDHKGEFTIDIINADCQGYHVDEGYAEFTVNDRIINISSLNFKDGNNFLQLSGLINPEKSVQISTLQIGYDLHYFVNAAPIKINWSRNEFNLKPFTVHVDDGIVNGFLNYGDYREGRIKFSNFNSSAVLEHIPNGLMGLSGIVFGEVSMMGEKGDESIEVELSLKNGSILNQSFDDLQVSAVFLDSVFHFDEFTLTEGEKVGIQFSGLLPFDRQKKGTVPIELLAELRQVDFGFLRQFIPDFIYMDGRISGELNLSGTTKDTRMSYDLEIDDAVFDRIYLGTVSGYGSYQNYRMDLGYFESDKGKNVIRGSGSLPIEFNIASDRFGQWVFGDTLDLNVTGKTRNLDFLSTYLSDVDSLTGDFDIGLFLSGVPEKIIRDGWVKVNNGAVYTILLDNTVNRVNGELRLIKNRMDVNHLAGVTEPSMEFNRRLSLRSALTGRAPKVKENIFISGSMDMTKFFQPRFNLKINAKEAYIRTLLGDIEGLVNINLTMVGRDTITYSGIIEPVNVEMKQEFTTSSVEPNDMESSQITSIYKLTFAIEEDFKLINSQLDADLTGELSMYKIGDQASDYSGELYINSGKFYYTGVIFTILSDGSMVFDGKGFNPDMDIQAETSISDYAITVSLAGRLDNPTLTFEESTNTLSQSDILTLLTLKTDFTDNNTSSKGFGQVSSSLVSAWFEQQLEKNLLQITRDLGIVDEVEITGAGGLIDESSTEDMTISAQRHLSEKLALNYSYSYKRSFGLDNQQLVGVEYKLNRYLSLVGNYDDEGNLQVKYRLRYSY